MLSRPKPSWVDLVPPGLRGPGSAHLTLVCDTSAVLPVSNKLEATGTIYVSGIDVVDGSAVPATQPRYVQLQTITVYVYSLTTRLDIKPYHPVESFGSRQDVERVGEAEEEVCRVFRAC